MSNELYMLYRVLHLNKPVPSQVLDALMVESPLVKQAIFGLACICQHLSQRSVSSRG